MKITIAIPTYNRVRHLECAIGAIRRLKVPDGVGLALAISNIASVDGTASFLNDLIIEDIELHVVNERSDAIHSNWYRLSKIIPKDTDYVWLHGDDDIIINDNAIFYINDVIKAESPICSIIVPQAKRLKGTNRRFINTLSNLCCEFGFHEVLGWMSQIITTYDAFTSAMSAHGKKIGDARSGVDLARQRVSAFQHGSEFLKILGYSKAALLDSQIIDEQEQIFKETITRREARTQQNLRDLFFFVPESLEFFHNNYQIQLNPIVFRYVNKSLGDLLANICLDDICNQTNPTLSVVEKLQILKNLYLIMQDCPERDDLAYRISFISSIVSPHENFELRQRVGGVTLEKAIKIMNESSKSRYSINIFQ
jgi:hypothetical protein